MSTAAEDTLGRIAIELARLLSPLQHDLTDAGRARGFFVQLGIPLTSAQATAMATPLAQVATAAGELAALAQELVAAIEAESYATITARAVQATVKVGQIIDGLVTLGAAAQGVGISAAVADALPGRIFDYLLAHYLDAARPLNDVLELVGLLDREDFNDDSTDPASPPFTVHTYRFDRIGGWFGDPAGQAAELYDWGSPGFDGHRLFARLEKLLARTGIPVIYEPAPAPARLDVVFLEFLPTSGGPPKGLVVRLKTEIATGVQTIPMGDARLEVEAEFQPPFDTRLTILSDGNVSFEPTAPAPAFGGRFGARLIVRRETPPEPFVLFGQADGSRVEIREVILGFGTRVQWSGGRAAGEFDVNGAVNGGRVVIDTTSGDGFLAKILPGTKIDAGFDLLLGVSSERGFYFGGSSALEVRLPAHIQLGPVSIEGLTLGARLQDGRIPVSVGADIKAELGPLTAVVQNMGVTATFSFPPGNRGNLGPLQMDLGFKPPNGVGLSVDAGPITGGGFLYLDFEKGEYFGALELSFQGLFNLKAVGIINTKMPDGSKGFALLILVTAEFTPIQLGFGFTLNGVGGLLGLNRSLDVQALRTGVRTGSVSSILFPPDVVGNITRIISDLKSFFPIAEGHFVVAPMAKLGWGTPTLISLELGVILDIPSPQLVIIGVLRCILPQEDAPILRLQVNFAGGIDFEEGLIWFDASLFDSSLLVFTLSGDMALRIGWGARAIFVISVGGFHPAFREIPPDLTGMRRLTIALLSGENPRLVAQAYFAITSNTVQSGARVELYAEAGGFNLYGYLGYDLLVQFDPFQFIADIYAGLALRSGTDVLAGLSVFCRLSGPTPWHAEGEASLKILFFEITVGFDVTWGDDAPALPDDTEDVLALVTAAVEDGRSWRSQFPANTSLAVTLRKLEPPADALLLHPFGVLSVSQKVAPLGVPIERFGNKRPVGATQFTVTWAAGAAEDVREEFAVSSFLNLSDSEKLSRPSFEKMKSGLRFATGDASSAGARVEKEVSYELSYVRRSRGLTLRGGIFALFRGLFDTLVGGGAAARSALSVSRRAGGNGPGVVEIQEAAYQVVRVSDLSPFAPGLAAATETEALLLHADLVRRQPSLEGALQVVSSHELFAEARP